MRPLFLIVGLALLSPAARAEDGLKTTKEEKAKAAPKNQQPGGGFGTVTGDNAATVGSDFDEPVVGGNPSGDSRSPGSTKPSGTIASDSPNLPPVANLPPPPADGGHVAVGGSGGDLLGAPPADDPNKQAAYKAAQDALSDYNKGDGEAAARDIQVALQLDPKNDRIKALKEIIIPHILTPMSTAAMKDRASNLLSGQRQTEGVDGAPARALLASPISWGQQKPLPPSNVPSPIQEFLRRDPAKEALLKLRLKDYAGAEEALTENLKQNPLDWLTYRMRALARRQQKKLQGSIDDATRALTLNPKDGFAHDIRSSDLTDLGHPKEGLEEAEAALKLNVDDAGAYVARSEALRRMGRDDEALLDLRRASELDAQFKDLYRSALARKEGAPSGRPRLAYAAAALAVILLLGGLSLSRRPAARTTTSSRKTPLRAGEREVPHGFEIVRTLGEGGMGVVYEAVDKSLERPVALKKMRAEIASDPRERRRLLKEARTVAALRHPNIVQIYSIVDDGPDLFLVFELLKGDTLSSLIGKLPPARTVELVAQVAAALDHAHSLGVIHRDLKPSNVLVTGEQAKVMDFGIARSALVTASTTTRHEIAGTPLYMAPEQEQGLPAQASDVYSLGVCAYEMLAGKLPFPGGGLMQKLNADYPKLSLSGHPAAVDLALAKALAPDPAQRFASAGDFARELRRALS